VRTLSTVPSSRPTAIDIHWYIFIFSDNDNVPFSGLFLAFFWLLLVPYAKLFDQCHKVRFAARAFPNICETEVAANLSHDAIDTQMLSYRSNVRWSSRVVQCENCGKNSSISAHLKAVWSK
jgi:hypothetical protein